MTQPLTMRTFFFGGPDDDADVVSRLLVEHDGIGAWAPPLARLSKAACGTIADQVGAAAVGLLDFDLASAVLGGWRKHQDLVRAARATAAAPAQTAVVELYTHRITSSYSPSVEVLVDSVPVHTVVLDLSLTFEIDCAEAVVRWGRLVEIRSGTALALGTLAVDRVRVAERRHSLVLRGVLRLGTGIPLVPSPRPGADSGPPVGSRTTGRPKLSQRER